MLDLILLGLLAATAILFVAATLDEVTRRIETRPSNRTFGVPNEAASQPTIKPAATDDDDERKAA